MITTKEYYKDYKFTMNDIRNDILSACCNAPVLNIEGSYEEGTGKIYDGYACTKCYKHLYDLKHFIKVL